MIGDGTVVIICRMLVVYDMLLQVMISERAKRVMVGVNDTCIDRTEIRWSFVCLLFVFGRVQVMKMIL